MNTSKCKIRQRSVSRIVSTTGRLLNGHFMLLADHLMLEVSPSDFQLEGAIAEGNVEVHMLGGGAGREYIVHASSAVFQSAQQRLVLNGWSGTRENGVSHPPTAYRREVILRTDGTFFHSAPEINTAAGAEVDSPSLQAA